MADEICFRKPCFAGDVMAIAHRPFRDEEGKIGVSLMMLPHASDAPLEDENAPAAHCVARLFCA